MKPIVKPLLVGILIGLLIPFCQGFVMVIVNIYSQWLPLSPINLPYFAQIFIYGFWVSLFLFFVQSILGAGLLAFLARYSQFRWIGIAAGIVVGLLVDIPYVLTRITLSQSSLNLGDLINLSISTLLFAAAGIYIFSLREWKNNPSHGEVKEIISNEITPPSSLPIPVSEPSSRLPGKFKINFHHLWVLTILIPPFLIVCLCLASLMINLAINYTQYTLADNLWSFRISQKLKDKGFSAQKISITRDKTDNLFSRMDIQVGIDDSKDYQEYQDVIKDVHKSIFEALDTPVFPPVGVGEIDVFINDDTIGYYRISVDYEIAHQYFLGTFKPGDYIQSWRFNSQ